MSDFTQPEIPLLNFLKNPPIESDISMFPETIGWKILMILLVLYVLYWSYKKILVWKSNKYRRDALRLIENNKESSGFKKATFLSKVLKDTIKLYSKELKINSLKNEELFDLLNSKVNDFGLKKESFVLWQNNILRPESSVTFNREEVKNIELSVIKWIKEHKKEEK